MYQTHHMNLNPFPLEKMLSGEKRVEIRIFDEKRQKIRIGDFVEFTSTEDEHHKVKIKVKALLNYPTFSDLVDDMPSDYFAHKDKDVLKKRIYRFYTKSQEEKYGVLGIKFDLAD